MAELVVRVQWGDGRVTEVSDGGSGRKRAITYARNDVTTVAQATQVGEALLETLGIRDSVSIGLEDQSDWPELGDARSTYGFADTLTSQRIVGRKVTWERNGYAIVTPVLGSPEEEFDARQKLAVERLATGTTAGRSAGVQPLRQSDNGVPSGVLRSVAMPPFSVSDLSTIDTATSHSPMWTPTEAVLVPKVTLLIAPPDGWTDPNDDAIDVSVEVNGSSELVVELPAGEAKWSTLTGLLIPANTDVQVIVSMGSNTLSEWENVRLTIEFETVPASMRVETTRSS